MFKARRRGDFLTGGVGGVGGVGVVMVVVGEWVAVMAASLSASRCSGVLRRGRSSVMGVVVGVKLAVVAAVGSATIVDSFG